MNNVPVPRPPFSEHPSEQNNFLLRFWGGNEEAARQKLGLKVDWASQFDSGWGGSYMWFGSPLARNAISDYLHTWDAVVSSNYQGKDAIEKKLLVLDFNYKDKRYSLTEKLGYGAERDNIHFYYTDGNMGCVCNQSIILHERFPEIPEMECNGKDLTLLAIKVLADASAPNLLPQGDSNS